MFAAEVDPNVDAATLLAAVGGVALVADNKKQEKTGKDEYGPAGAREYAR